jgi:hypothetical protein
MRRSRACHAKSCHVALAVMAAALAVMTTALGSATADTVRVGKAGRDAFSFVPADVGQQT